MKSSLYHKSLISVNDLTLSDVRAVWERARQMKRLVDKSGGDDRLKGKVLAALFYEPSSRTFSSFITAMQRLGGGIIPLNGMSQTSVAKGESLEDTARVFSCFADVLVVRHPEPGSVEQAAKYAYTPVINAGDGVNEHPTQALIDLFTITEKFGNVDTLNILMIGDLAHYRPTNSLMKLLALFPGVTLHFATPAQTPIRQIERTYLQKKQVRFHEHHDFLPYLADADVLYVTRVKKEYMTEELYKTLKGSYVVDASIAGNMKKNSIIMHCLPRIDEIHTDIDGDPRQVYMKTQIQNGLYVRMALLDMVLRK